MGKQWKQCQTLIFWAPKSLQMVTFSHEIKRRLLLGRKVTTNLDSIFKSRDISFPTKFHLVKVIVFLVVMYGCESWTIKMLSTKELMLLNCGVGVDSWESLGLQGDPTSPSEGDQPWVFFGGHDTNAATPVLWPPHARVDSLEKTLMLGGIGGRRRRGQQRMRWLDGITDSMDVSLS